MSELDHIRFLFIIFIPLKFTILIFGLAWLKLCFFAREWKEKFDLVDNEDEDTLTYHYKNTFIFRPDLSGPELTGDELIVMPHPCMTLKCLFLLLS